MMADDTPAQRAPETTLDVGPIRLAALFAVRDAFARGSLLAPCPFEKI